MFNRCKRVFRSFDRVGIEIKKASLKKLLLFGFLFLFFGALICFAGGEISRIVYLYKRPAGAITYPTMHILWGISFFLSGVIFAGILYGCEKYRRHITYKILLMIILMQLCAYLSYPLFFKATAPFLAFLALAIAIILCIFAIFSSYRIYTLWTTMLVVKCVWLVYIAYIYLGFSIIN